MARVTVEDCVEKIPSRFELVLMASKRARQISGGAPLTLPRDRDKNTVVSLREIAEGTIALDTLRQTLVTDFRKPADMGVSDDDAAQNAGIDFLRDSGEAAIVVEEEFDNVSEGPVDGADFADENVEAED